VSVQSRQTLLRLQQASQVAEDTLREHGAEYLAELVAGLVAELAPGDDPNVVMQGFLEGFYERVYDHQAPAFGPVLPARQQIAVVSFDESFYIGDGTDGVYYQVGEARGVRGVRDGWYLSTVVDSDTGGFVQDMDTDDGPYDTFEAAMLAGQDAAGEWCYTNNVNFVDDPEDEDGEEG